ncbi:YgcG family protein [Acaryochloris sp. IP29b_bin.137]|uniref:TPM domain-containing protein n=1 Tax=Acaryochloris sp. IP29b_bin.137 TaxID=2969217 RepID=UPI00261E322F|nr:TPM domain-containing protein [Acaryochloris sp. IP29b_bin.137]
MFLSRLKQRERSLLTFILALGFSLFLSIFSLTPSRAIPVSEVPNPRQDNHWVMDMADVLSPDSEAKLNQMITALEEKNGAEIAIVTVLDTKPSASPKAFATELFNTWGIGKEGIDNGVLFLVSKNERRTEIETGYGLESILPDAKVSNILRTQIIPHFKQGHFESGIVHGTQAIIQVLETEQVGSQVPSTHAEPTLHWFAQLSEQMHLIIAGGIAFIVTGVVTMTSVVLARVSRKKQVLSVSPVGRTIYQEQPNTWPTRGWFWILRWLAGDYNATETRPLKMRIAFNPTKEVVQTWWTFFGLLMGLWLLTSFIKGITLFKLLLIWGWLGYEIWRCAKRDQPLVNAVKTALGKLIILGFVASLLLLFVAGAVRSPMIGRILLPSLFAAFGGACAWTLRQLRSLSHNIEVRCESCHHPMQRLDDTALEQHLRPADKVAQKLESTRFEGWHCPACSPAQAENGFDLHLLQEVLQSNRFEHCSECDAYTVTSTFKILQHATTSATGEKLVTGECACCHQQTEQQVTIPRISKASKSNWLSDSSGSSSSFGSSSDFGSSSSTSSGGDFGGGSSGGGGAGDSW